MDLVASSSIAPSLHATAASLGKALMTDSLKKDMTERPTKEDLVQINVLKGNPWSVKWI